MYRKVPLRVTNIIIKAKGEARVNETRVSFGSIPHGLAYS